MKKNLWQTAVSKMLIQVSRSCRKQAILHYWCLFCKKDPSAHGKQACFLPLDLMWIFQQPKVISASALEVQSTSGIMPELILLTPSNFGPQLCSVGCLQLVATSRQLPAARTASAYIKMDGACWPACGGTWNESRRSSITWAHLTAQGTEHAWSDSGTLRRMTE